MPPELETLLRDFLRGSGLFAGVTAEQILALTPEHGRLEEGAALFEQGQPGDHAFLLLQGILGLQAGGLERGNTYFRKVVAGELVGEYGPLCGEPRSASAVALTAIDYLQLDRDQLLGLLQAQPALQTRFISSLAEAASLGRQPGRVALETIVIHDASPGSALTAVAQAQLADDLRRLGADLPGLEDLIVHPEGEGEGPGNREADLYARLVEISRGGRPQVLFNRDPLAISRRNRLLIDRLLILSDGQAQAITPPLAVGDDALLVWLWPSRDRWPHSRPWAAAHPYAQVLNLQPELGQHRDRLGRAVLRRQNVLLLGGGGARGFAHIGALAALEDLGIDDLDMVMGVSIGSLVASLAAFELPAAEILANLERVIIHSRPYSFTLPRDSLFTLRNSRKELERFFGAAEIQDSWLPLRCFSANLTANRLHTWSTGSIPSAVIASMSVPGIFPPVVDAQGQLHVDGGILSNLPVAEARRCTDGRVMAISLDPDPGAPSAPGAGVTRERPSIGRTIINALMCGSHAEGQLQERLADQILRPAIGTIPFLDWKRYRESYAMGYEAAQATFGPGSRNKATPPALN
ncbi:MAG: patatin-like phospholipase family protein [Vulcanococcus sp.]